MFKLNRKCLVNKYIPKKIMYEHLNVSSAIKEEFITTIEKIVWLYKLSPDTIGLSKTENVAEIEIFELKLKERKVPKKAIKIITKGIPYPILFVIKYQDEVMYSIKASNNYYTKWDEKIEFSFDGLTLETLYENIVKQMINEKESTARLERIIEVKETSDILAKKIVQLEAKMKTEKQFNKKMKLNDKIKELRKKMEDLKIE